MADAHQFDTTASKPARKSRRRFSRLRATILLAMISAACAPAGVAGTPAASQEQASRHLTTSELETLLRGSRITQPDRRERYMRTPEEFRDNGTYVRHEDNFEAHGKYNFRDDAVCVTAEQDPEICRKVMVDRDGRYWITSRNNSRLLIRISVQPLR